MSSTLYSNNDTVGDIEHYAIALVQIATPSCEALPQETGL